MVEQLGLATNSEGPCNAWAFTSGTTKGTDGSMRQAEELSMTRIPASVKRGAHSMDTDPPAENKAKSAPLSMAV